MEDDGVKCEDEFNKSKEREMKLKKDYEIAHKGYDRLSREIVGVEKRHDELAEKLKEEIYRDIVEEELENTEVEEIRKSVDRTIFLDIREEDLIESEEESESEEKSESEEESESDDELESENSEKKPNVK